MKKSLLKLLWVVAGLMLSTTISAVGMGGINVTSGLGQQLKADIELVSVNNAEKTSLVARLASPEVYKGAGLEYPYGNKFKFQIESRSNGAPYLNVTSAQPVNDPFVVMLVELSWSSGRLLREYTFLLDPPGYVMELPVQTKVQAVAPSVQPETPQLQTAEVTAMLVEPTAPQEEVAESKVAPDPDISSADSEEQDQDAAASVSDAVPSSEQETLAVPAEQEIPIPDETLSQEVTEEAVAPENIAMGEFTEPNEEWIGVQRGDTLGKISLQYKSADVSLERMLVAMYRANAAEFGGKNMNRIRAGKILRLPSQQEIDAVGHSEAAKEIRAQTADWNVYRQKLAGAASESSRPQTAEQVASGKLTSSVADKAPVSKDSAKEVLKLSKGEAPGDQVATGAADKSQTVQEKNNAAQEDAIAAAKTVKEGQARTAMLE
ncbi:MAG: FimV/HubP family polar landmark protein, partial [Gallionella sp.]